MGHGSKSTTHRKGKNSTLRGCKDKKKHMEGREKYFKEKLRPTKAHKKTRGKEEVTTRQRKKERENGT